MPITEFMYYKNFFEELEVKWKVTTTFATHKSCTKEAKLVEDAMFLWSANWCVLKNLLK